MSMSQITAGTAFNLAEAWYEQTAPERDLITDLLWYARHHYLYVGDDCLIMAHVWDDHDSWHIFFAIGDKALSKFLSLMPFPMPYITFERPLKSERFRRYPTERFRKVCLALERSKT
jgi:hypothetical protein